MRSWTKTWAVTVALALIAGAACGGNAFDSSQASGDASTAGDAMAETGPGDGTGGDGPSSADGADGATGAVVYVSNATGDDTRTGLDRSHPKKTIASALIEAATLGAGAQVHACAGTYPEASLQVTSDVKLQGGYACASWLRSLGYGYPTFDGTNLSTITNAAPSAQGATLVVKGAVTNATLVDGFVIAGAAASTTGSVGIDVQGGASPVLANDVVSGGGAAVTSGSWGSIGVRIGDSSSAELTRSVVSGGSGQAAAGSAGILVQSTGTPSVHEDVVSGGSGKSNGAMPNLAAVGIAILSTLDPSKPLTSVLVTGTDTAGVAGNSVGVLVQGSGVDAVVAGCAVIGGKGDAAMSASVGIDLETSGTVSLLANRIDGGARTGAGAQTYGVRVGTAGTVTVANDEIHAGAATGGSNAYSVGIDIAAGAAPTVVDDTIYTGSVAGSLAVDIEAGVTGAVLHGNLLVGGGTTASDTAIVAGSCSAGIVAALDHTAFANFGTVYQCIAMPVDKVAPDPGTMATLLGGGVSTTGNIEFENACSGALPWCVVSTACPSASAATCAQALFGATWSADDGVTGLFATSGVDGGVPGGGWKLAAGNPCALAKGGDMLTAFPTDLFGVTRGSTPSMGAAQDTSACQ